MAQDPRTFLVKPCPKGVMRGANEDTKRKDFFGALGKIGDIEVLNRFGDGEIAEGLRSLTKISDSIRTGGTDSAIIPNSSGYVLDAVGINPNAAQQAGGFNPGVLNRGVAQAESILDDVKKGDYNLSDIPDSIQDLQNLGSLIGGIFTDSSGHRSTRDLEICGASPYAIDLIKYAPKYKFLFIVQVTLNEEYVNLDYFGKQLAFVVKSSTRPNINVEHEEVNMYNFWTRIPKRTVYEPITMRFYDDNKSLGHLFYTMYLRSISPISRMGGMDASIMSSDWLEANSMNFNSAALQGAASMTALEGINTSIIKEIRLFHLYDYGRSSTVYHFYNPKLLTMNLDELDMVENGSGNEIELNFGYDSMHITPALSVNQNQERIENLTGAGTFATYPITPNFQEGVPDETPEIEGEDGGLLTTIKNEIRGPLATITKTKNQVKGLVSDAFSDANDFLGSVFL